MRIVLLGKTGDGKSSSGNTILGDSSTTKFLNQSSPISVTRNCEVGRGHRLREQTPIEIIDTPGFFDTSLSDEELKPEIVKCITRCAPGPHAFIIVLRVGRYTEQEMATMAKIERSFGECAFKYSAVLFTHGDQLEDDQTIEEFVEKSKELKELVEKCGGGCHVIDNKYWIKKKGDKNSVQVEKLLNTIEEMVRKNGGGCYTNKLLQAVEAGIQRQEEEIRKENPNEKSTSKIRDEAIGRLTDRLLAKFVGLATGAILGALLGDPFGIGAIRGGVMGYQAVGDGDTVLDAVHKATNVCVEAQIS